MVKECKVLSKNSIHAVVVCDGVKIQIPAKYATKDVVYLKYENDKYTVVNRDERSKNTDRLDKKPSYKKLNYDKNRVIEKTEE